MDEKRLFYVHTCLWPSQSPSVVFVTGAVYGLASRVPTVLVVRSGSDEPSESVFHSLSGLDIPAGLNITRFGSGKKTLWHGSFFRKAVSLISGEARKDRVYAVISRSIGFLPYLLYLRLRYNVPCFFETHDYYGDLSVRPDLPRNLLTYKKHWFECMFLRHLDGAICLTSAQEDFFLKTYPGIPCRVAPTGLFRVCRNDSRREKQLCYVGSLDEHKGLGTVLSALAQTADKDIRLLVVGGRNDREKRGFKDLARILGIEDRVRVVSWVHRSDIDFLMDTSIAGLVPLSDTPFNRYFTSPLKMLDYFSRSLPVIASDLPPVREYMEHERHGLLFQPDNPESLAQAIDHYTAVNSFEFMSAEVASHAEQFLWTKRGSTVVDFIEETIRR